MINVYLWLTEKRWLPVRENKDKITIVFVSSYFYILISTNQSAGASLNETPFLEEDGTTTINTNTVE